MAKTIVTVDQGGTGAETLTDGGVLLGSGVGAVTATAVLADGEILVGDGTTDPVALDVGSSTAITVLGTVATGTWNGTAIANANLANSAVTVGTTSISLGASSTTLAGLTSVTSTGFTGDLTGEADTVTTNANLTGDVTSSGNATTIATDAVDIAMLSATGTASSSTYLRGDNTWATVSGGSGTVTSVGGTGTVNGLTLTGTVTSSGNLTLGGTLPVEIGIACSDEATVLTTGDSKAKFMIPEAMTLTEVKASLGAVETDVSGMDVDVRYHATDPTAAGATVFSGGDLNIASGAYYETEASLAVTALAENSFVMVDINGPTSPDSKGLKIWLIGTRT